MSGEGAASVLVAIPVLNEEAHLERVIDSLSEDLPGGRVTIVVVDGGSTDGTRAAFDRAAADRPHLQWLANPQRIQSAAINLAALTHGGSADVLVRCDAHAVYPAGFVRRVVESLAAQSAGSVVVPMDSAGETCFQRAVAWVSDSRVGSGGSAHRGGARSGFVDHGHHAAMRMADFRRAGGYDETFTHNEDAELDCRLRGLGSRIFLDADIRLTYHPRASLPSLWRQYFAYGKGRSRTVRKHPGSMRLRQLAVPLHVALVLASLLLANWWPWVLAWPGLYLTVMTAVSLQLAVRHRSACGLLGGVAGICMHFAWGIGFFAGLALIREQVWLRDAQAAR